MPNSQESQHPLAHTREGAPPRSHRNVKKAKKPKIQHAKRLDKFLTWIQRNPKKLTYRDLKGLSESSAPSNAQSAAFVGIRVEEDKLHTLRIISDAAYEKEPEDGYSGHNTSLRV